MAMNKHSTKSRLKYKNNGVNVFKNTVYMHTNPLVRKSDKEKYTHTHHHVFSHVSKISGKCLVTELLDKNTFNFSERIC